MGQLEVGLFAEFVATVARQLPRNLDPAVVQKWMEGDGQQALRNALDRALRDGPPLPVDPDAWVHGLDLSTIQRREFTVTINPGQMIEPMVMAGHYNYANPAHTTAVFGPCCVITGNKPVEQKVVAFCIGRNATREQATRLRNRLNLGAICIQHQLALGAQHQQAQRDLHWIVNPDDVVLVDGCQYVSYLHGDPDDRDLNLDYAAYEWSGGTWFLGLLSE